MQSIYLTVGVLLLLASLLFVLLEKNFAEKNFEVVTLLRFRDFFLLSCLILLASCWSIREAMSNCKRTTWWKLNAYNSILIITFHVSGLFQDPPRNIWKPRFLWCFQGLKEDPVAWIGLKGWSRFILNFHLPSASL